MAERRTSMDPGLSSGLETRARAAQSAEPDLWSTLADASAPVEEESLVPDWMETWRAAGPDQRAAQRERWKQRLEPLLHAMLRVVPVGHGVTAAELVDEAMQPTLCSGYGIILPAVPDSDPRIFSFVGPWLAVLAKQGKLTRKTARLEGLPTSIHLKREASRDAAHGNEGLIYLAATH